MASLSTAQAPESLSKLFRPSTDQEICQRCLARVYQVEKVGPVNEVIFHKHCFKCAVCDQHLTLRTYFTNQEVLNDKEIYCGNHAPKTSMHGYDGRAVGMQHAMKAPRAAQINEISKAKGYAPKFGSDALFIKNPMLAQGQYGNKYKTKYDKHQYPAIVVSKTKESLYKHQEELERKQRVEEDRLLKIFESERKAEAEKLKKEYNEEWEISLQQLADKFETREKKTKKGSVGFENEKQELMKNLTVKMKKKKDAVTIRLQKKEQEETSELVKEHSGQMLELLKSKQEDIKRQLLDNMNENNMDSYEDPEAQLSAAMAAISMPTELPDPHPPRCRKRDLYTDPSIFAELDEDVIRVAESEQSTFTELVKNLTEHCLSDLQKARAIFRWITVKDLNVMEFDELVEQDTPMGLLRGIKFGTETYHTLFMRLCSYAGLACVEIKGHSKSVGYEPGMKIREDSFQNTWNAVLIDGDWWPVQCNWGARHLVLNKDVQDKPVKSKKQDKIRYQYDEHYFLTDPDEFIQEFWAQDINWQLLDRSVDLENFESMPFVRSVFFHYGLEFEKPMKSVLNTDQKGGSEVKIRVPTEFARDLVFHYQIRFADRERRHETEFRGAKLERFVFHSLQDGYALFSVHVPVPSAYFLEIFANKIDESNKIGDDPNATMMPFRLKCACKFKIVCDELVGKMHPLPNCASGEWGPSKGQRHFGLRPVTHDKGVINVDNDAEIRFTLPRSLHFLCKLRRNGVEDALLEKHVSHSVFDNTFTVRVRPPQPGQYGIDIYARPEDAADNHTLAHACKYLLNCTRVNDPVDLQISQVETKMSKDKWGPMDSFAELGMSTISHPESTIEKTELGAINIELELSQAVKLSYHYILEPNEDFRKEVTMKDSSKKVKFTINTPKQGNYLFAVYARKKKDSENNMANVYNYMIRYRPKEKDSTLNKKKKGLFK